MRSEKASGLLNGPALARGLVVVGIVCAFAWLTLRPSTPPNSVRVSTESDPAPAQEATPSPTETPRTPATPTPTDAVRGRIDDSQRPPPLALSTGALAWEQQLADAATGHDATGKARALFALLDRLPEEALAATAEQAVAQLPDKDYATTALPLVTDAKTHGQVLTVLFADLMERPDAIALPALLTIARNEAHPYSPPALDNLRLLLRADHATDWAKWESAVREATGKKR